MDERMRGRDDEDLLAECHDRALELLARNLSPSGVLAATPGSRADRRGYGAVFGRDAAICACAMATSGDDGLRRGALAGLETLGRAQAPNGQIPKFVDPARDEADFWYLGCIDATLWWLVAIAELDARGCSPGFRDANAGRIARALTWLEAQEHQRFHLLQQNEASDWADIMPRSGFVLYTNALWYRVKTAYGRPGADLTRSNFNHLFHPFSADLAEYRRGRLLADYALRHARHRELYLSFVNFSFFGEEGDVFGNLLALLLGLADGTACERTLAALAAARVQDPWPVRAVLEPILESHRLWRPYMSRHEQNFAWQYHNGGIWPMVGGFWVMALVDAGRMDEARDGLLRLARACELGHWQFNEWLHGQTGRPSGMPGQSWNAAAFLLARQALTSGRSFFHRAPG
jgi:glycogen debranching enzyme